MRSAHLQGQHTRRGGGTRRALHLAWSLDKRAVLTLVLLCFAWAGLRAASVELARALVDGSVDISATATGWADSVAIAAAVLAIVQWTTYGAGMLLTSRDRMLRMRLQLHAEERVSAAMASAPLMAFDSNEWRDAADRAKTSADRFQLLVSTATPALTALSTVAGMSLILASIDPTLIPFGLLALLLPIPVERLSQNALYAIRWAQVRQRREQAMWRSILSSPNAAKDVRALTLEDYGAERHRDLTQRLNREERDVYSRANRRTTAVGLLAGLTLTGAYLVALGGKLGTSASPGEVAAVIAALTLISSQAASVADLIVRVEANGRYLDDYFAFVAMPGPGRPDMDDNVAESAPFQIRLDSATFAYAHGSPVLRDLSLSIQPGELVALVGSSGAGKTTLIRLLTGLYQASAGTVRLGTRAIEDISSSELSRLFGVMFQEPLRLEATLRDNVTMGRDLPDDRVLGALAQVGLDRSGTGRAWHLDEQLGKLLGGIELSAGQWRRLALARLFVSDAPVWILDEPTASLDPEAESEFFDTFRSLLGGRTGIIVSHRFNTVRMADRILVLAHGRVIEDGSHEGLLAADGRYAANFRLQSSAYR